MAMMEASEEDEYEDYTHYEVVRDREDIYRNFGILCVELKHLYVAITRPKERLLIFDDNSKGRGAISDFWDELNVVDTVKKGEEKDHPVLKKGFECLDEESNSIE